MERLSASDAQKRIWSASRLDAHAATYHIPVALRWAARLDHEQVERAVAALVSAHESLRTRFGLQAGLLEQIIDDQRTLEIPQQACSEAQLAGKLVQGAGEVFDLERGPLLRVQHFLVGQGEQARSVLLWVVHHLIADGLSMNILLRDFCRALQGEAVEDPDTLAFADLSEWQREYWQSPEGQAQVASAKARLEGSSPRALRRGVIAFAEEGKSGMGLERKSLDAALSRSLVGLQQEGYTPLSVFYCGLLALLARRGAGADLCVGTVLSARQRPELQAIVGPVANTVVLRQQIPAGCSMRELLQGARSEILAAHERSEVPIEALMRGQGGARDRFGHPLFDLMFLVQPEVERGGAEFEILSLDLVQRSPKFPLTLSWTQDARRVWRVQAEFDAGRFDASAVRAFLDDYLQLLATLAQEPETPVEIAATGERLQAAPKLRSSSEIDAAWPALKGALSALLGDRSLSRSDDFFALGGDSILAMQLSAQLREQSLSLSTQAIFESPRLGEMSRQIESLEETTTPELDPASWTGPPSPLASGLLYHSQRAAQSGDASSELYIQQFQVRLRGACDPQRWQRAWDRVLDRHCSLRSLFSFDGPQGIELSFGEPGSLSMPILFEEVSSAALEYSDSELARIRQELGAKVHRPWMRLDLRSDGQQSRWVWSYHHALLDGWSASLVLEELLRSYAADEDNATPVQDYYPTYLKWVHKQAIDLAWWSRSMRGARTQLAPPRRVAASGHQSREQHRLVVAPEVAQSLRARCRAQELTLSSCMLAAWSVVRARHSGARRWVWGCTLSGRDLELPGMGGMVGLLMNTLPLTVQLDTHRGLRDWIRQLFEDQQALSARSHVPLAKIRPPQPGARGCFDELWVFENYPVASQRSLPGLEVLDISFFDASHYPLCAIASDHEELSLRLSYDPQRYSSATVQGWLSELGSLLQCWAAHPDWDQPLAALWPSEPCRELLRPVDVRSHTLAFRDQLLEASQRHASKVAIESPGERWSYAELFGSAQQLRQAQSLREGQRVLLCLPPGPAFVVAALACQLAGASYIPLDPALPPERLRKLSDRARADHHWGVLRGALRLVEELPALREQGRGLHAHFCTIHPQACAYAIYTSGSTGEPKLVGVTYQGLAELCQWHRAQYAPGPGKKVASLAGVGFDASVWDLWPTLASGATLCFAPLELRKDSQGLRAWIEAQGIADAFVPTAMIHRWSSECWPRSAELLRLRTGGEALRVLPSLPGYPLINHYGPTEASVVASAHPLDGAALDAPASIGQAVGHSRIDLLDPCGFALPCGGVGEIAIGGPASDNIYLDDPRESALRWIPDPAQPGARRYRSGDLAWRDELGNLHYQGRVDRQVQRSGVRIEPGEIESAIVRDTRVRDAAVVVHQDEQGPRFCAAVVFADPEDSLEALQERLREGLPSIMMPSAWQRLEALPLTSSDKLDREALSDLPWAQASAAVAPRSEDARRMLALWRSLLPAVPEDEAANFFALGGDSIVAVQLLARACAQGFELRAGDIEQAPTVAQLVQRHQVRKRAPQSQQRAHVGWDSQDCARLARVSAKLRWGDALEEIYPATPLQAGMLFVAQSDPEAPERYLESIQLRVHQPLDEAALRTALGALVQEYQTLCTAYQFDPECGPLILLASQEYVQEQARKALVVVNAQEEGLSSALLQARAELSDWGHPLLLRAVVHAQGASSWELHLLFSHVILDGWSTGHLLGRWLALYDHARSQRALPAASKSDLRAYWRWAARQDPLPLDRFWSSALAGIESPSLLGDEAAQEDGQGWGSEERSLPAGLAKRLGDRAELVRVTPHALCMAAFALLLSRRLRQRDICFASTVSLRPPELEGVEEMVGLLLNTVVARFGLPAQLLASDFVQRVHHGHASMRRHAAISLSRALGLAGYNASSGAQEGLFDSLFVYENYPRFRTPSGLDEQDTPKVEVVGNSHRTHYALSLTILAHQSFALRWGFDRTRIPEKWALGLHEEYVSILEALCARPDAPLAELARKVQPASGHHLAPRAPSLTCAFWTQVERRPEQVALVDAQGLYRYRCLGQRVAALAAQLEGQGVGSGEVVILGMKPSWRSVVALWAVWQRGAAFWVVDPETPTARLSRMLDQVPVRLWIGDEHPPEAIRARGIKSLRSDHESFARGEVARPQPCTPHPQALAYVMYTSGSTGVPKAVMVGHDSLERHQAWVRASRDLGAEDVVLHKTPLSFDGALWEVLAPLTCGARCVIAPSELRLDARRLWSFMVDHRVTAMQFVPSWLGELVHQARRDARSWPSTLRLLALGGERVEPQLLREIYDRAGSGQALQVHNVYGPTECTVDVSAKVISGAPQEGQRVVAMGQAVAGATNYVLDPDLQPVAPQSRGELFLGGSALAWGYASSPRETALRFLPDPFSSILGARMYRSSDLVYRDSAGDLVFVGRSDDQLKLGGHRLDLLEIDAVLADIAPTFGLSQTAAVVFEMEGRQQLGAAYRSAAKGSVDLAAVRREVAKFLLASQRPRHWIEVQDWPKTKSGKLDRKALRAHFEAQALPSGEVAADETGLVARIIQVWQGVFGAETLGVQSDFFELGGDSIACMQLVGRLREAGIACEARDVFESPVLGEFAQRLRGRSPKAPPPRTWSGAVEALPLAPIQADFVARSLVEAEHFNQSIVVRLRQSADPDAISTWLTRLVERYPILCAANCSPAQAWPLHQLHFVNEEEHERQAQIERAFQDAHLGLSREQGPRCRAVYAQWEQAGEEQALLQLVIHHWVVDAVSWRNLVESLSALAAGRSLPDTPDEGMRRWREQLGAYAASSAAQREVEYWCDLAGQQAPLELIASAAVGTVSEAKTLSAELSAERTACLLRWAAQSPRVPLATLMMVALARSVWRAWDGPAAGQSLCLAVEGHGRESAAMADLLSGAPKVELGASVGWFTSIYPWFGRGEELSGALTRELIARADRQLQSAPLGGAGFSALKYQGRAEHRQALETLNCAQISWNYLGQMDARGQDPWVQEVIKDPAQAQGQRNQRAYALDASAYLAGGRLHLVFSYCGRSLDEGLVEQAFAAWQRELEALPAQAELQAQRQSSASSLPDLAEIADLLDLELEGDSAPAPQSKETL